MKIAGALLALTVCGAAMGLTPAAAQTAQPPIESQSWTGGDVDVEAPEWQVQVRQLTHALVRLPLAAGLACLLALRPRRRGTPPRTPSVIQTQIILAVVGAIVMLVVGSSLARAFGIVGAAGLVRYRAKIDDPKDAGVMLSTLAIGLAAGVGLWMIATFAALFVMAVLWVIESFEKAKRQFTLKIQASDPVALKPKVEDLLTRQKIEFDVRSTTEEELWYEVRIPLERKTDRLSASILKLDPEAVKGVEFDDKKPKK
jgi:uncharacterized membrane protein YhiD involved in acid resistance